MNEPAGQKATLREVLNYQADQYLSEEELNLVKFHFRDNPTLLKILRKIFIPTIADPELPIEEMGQDAWMVGVDFMAMPAEHVKAVVQGRQEGIKFVMGGLISLKQIASESEESAQNRAQRRAKDSTK